MLREKSPAMPPADPPRKSPAQSWLADAPRGMWYEYRAGAAEPYRARWELPGGKRAGRKFGSAADRARFAAEWHRQRVEHGRAMPFVSPAERAIWDEFSRLTGHADPLEVAAWWAKVRGTVGGQLSVPDAVDRYLAHRDARPAARDTLNHLRLHLRRFAATHRTRTLGSVTTEEIRAWLAGLTSRRTGGALLSDGSRRHHYISINLLYGHAQREGWIDQNPMERVDAPQWGQREDEPVLTLDQARTLFSSNATEPVVARLALEAFGGLRASSAGRLEADHVKWSLLGIELPGAQHKSRRRHYVDGQPPCLWAWLAHCAFTSATWAMSERSYAQEKSRAFTRAGIPPMHNALRHSFATYHLHGFKDPGRTAVLMQHRRSPEILWRHYAGRATEADGRAYFQILPPALSTAAPTGS